MDWAPLMPASSLQFIANLVGVVPINDFFWNENLLVNFLSSIPTLHSQCPYFVQRYCVQPGWKLFLRTIVYISLRMLLKNTVWSFN